MWGENVMVNYFTGKIGNPFIILLKLGPEVQSILNRNSKILVQLLVKTKD